MMNIIQPATIRRKIPLNKAPSGFKYAYNKPKTKINKIPTTKTKFLAKNLSIPNSTMALETDTILKM